MSAAGESAVKPFSSSSRPGVTAEPAEALMVLVSIAAAITGLRAKSIAALAVAGMIRWSVDDKRAMVVDVRDVVERQRYAVGDEHR